MQALESFYEHLLKKWNKPLRSRKLSQTQTNLINDICTLKDVNIKAVDLSHYKKYYKHLPSTANIASMHYLKSGEQFNLNVKFLPILHKFVANNLKCTPISYAYNIETNRYYMVIDNKVKMVSCKVAEQFMGMVEYESFLKEHFTKDREAFINALTGNH